MLFCYEMKRIDDHVSLEIFLVIEFAALYWDCDKLSVVALAYLIVFR